MEDRDGLLLLFVVLMRETVDVLETIKSHFLLDLERHALDLRITHYDYHTTQSRYSKSNANQSQFLS